MKEQIKSDASGEPPASGRSEQDECRFHRVLDDLLEGCQIIDRDYRYVYVNSAAATQGRSTPARLVGESMFDMYPGIGESALFKAIAAVMETRKPVRAENVFTFPDGESGWFELSIQPVPEGVLILSLQITERKKAEIALRERVRDLERAKAETDLLATIVEKSRIAIGVGFPDGSLGMVNQAYCDLAGYTHEELKNVNWIEALTPPEWRDVDREHLAQLAEGAESVRYEKECLRRDGTRIPISVLVQTIRDESGIPIMNCVFASDLTERKKQLVERDALIKEKDQLLLELRHRVKNSLNMINAILYLQEADTRAQTAPEALRSVRGRIEVLTLLYRQNVAGASQVRLDEYLRAICDSMSYTHDAATRGILIASDLEEVSIDLKRGGNIGLAVNELIGNALKYAFPPDRLDKRGGTIELSLKKHDGQLTLSVSDDGVGLPDCACVFESAGMGLKLASELLEQSDGKMEVVNEGPGTAFRVTIRL